MESLLKILLVDDDEVDRMAVRRAFKKSSVEMELSEAEDAQTAIALLQNTNFDCVFLDYLLPDQDGLELVKKLVLMGIKVPVIVLTGQGDEQIAVEMMKAGASDYLSKSRISPEVLSHTLRQAIRIHDAETEAELANQKLRESNQLKSEFLSILSHELRTPMNAIMGFSQILLSHYPDPLTPQQINIVERIHSNSQNLLTMINEVLDFSKIEAGQMTLCAKTFNLANLVKMTVEELRSLAIQKNLSLEVDIDLENPLVLNDQNGCRRVLVNLLSNALKFTSTGGVVVKVWQSNQDQIAIAVKDTGIGMASESLETIFEPFRQVDQSTVRHYEGTGLGLAIAYAQVKMMQGKITVESQLGQGSIFQIEFSRQIET